VIAIANMPLASGQNNEQSPWRNTKKILVSGNIFIHLHCLEADKGVWPFICFIKNSEKRHAVKLKFAIWAKLRFVGS